MTHDDSSSYTTEITNSDEQAFNIDWPGPMASWDGVLTAGSRDSLTVTGGADGSVFTWAICNAAGTKGSTNYAAVVPSSGVWTTRGPADISNGANYRPGGGAWTQADFVDDKTMFPVVITSGLVDDAQHLTSVWGEISYSPVSGGFVFLLNLAGLGALPFVGAMDFGHFLRYLSWRERYHPRHTRWSGRDEILRAWQEVRAYRHPRFFLPAVV